VTGLFAFATTVYAWAGAELSVTGGCNKTIQVTATESDNHDFKNTGQGTLDFWVGDTTSGNPSFTAPWKWDTTKPDTQQVIATGIDVSGKAAGKYTVALNEDRTIKTTFLLPMEQPQGCPTPAPTPTSTTTSTPTPTPTATAATTTLANTGGFDFRFPLIGLILLVAGGTLYVIGASRGRSTTK
jgi:hypothetical protein